MTPILFHSDRKKRIFADEWEKAIAPLCSTGDQMSNGVMDIGS